MRFRFLRRKPRVEFALLVILLMWASHSWVSLRQTPRYGVDETFTNVSPFRVYWNSRFFDFGLDTLRTEHFEGLKHIPHRSAQSCNADRSLCSFSWSARHFIGRYRRQSSAKRRTCDETERERLLFATSWKGTLIVCIGLLTQHADWPQFKETPLKDTFYS